MVHHRIIILQLQRANRIWYPTVLDMDATLVAYDLLDTTQPSAIAWMQRCGTARANESAKFQYGWTLQPGFHSWERGLGLRIGPGAAPCPTGRTVSAHVTVRPSSFARCWPHDGPPL